MSSPPCALPQQAPVSSFWCSAKSVFHTASWWRQQAWVVSTEILMGFLAAWGLMQGLGSIEVPLGLAVVYGVDALGVAAMTRFGRRAAVILAGITMIASTMAFWRSSGNSWWLLCVAAGGLLAFRDQQTIHSLSWMPIRAHRRGGNSMMALVASAAMGALVVAAGLVAAGFGTHYWRALPLVVAMLACFLLLPTQVLRIAPHRVLRRLRKPQAQLTVDPELSWLLRLSLIFNAVNFLGRRIVLPLAVLSLARDHGMGADSLPLLGGALGLMGLVGMLLRLPNSISRRVRGSGLLRWGARLSLLGWAFIGIGAALLDVSSIAWMGFLAGWVLLELTNKTWATGYVEALRFQAVGNRITACRAYRHALREFMTFKSAGGSIGCALAALLTPTGAPWLVAALAAGCWWWLENPPAKSAPQGAQ